MAASDRCTSRPSNRNRELDDLTALGQRTLAAQPFSRLLGAELIEIAPGFASIRIDIDGRMTQQNGFVHGGAVCYAADNAIAFAGGSSLGAGVVSVEMKINYLRPAAGSSLIARAIVVHCGRRQAVCRCEIYDCTALDERHCATAVGTVALLPGGHETA
jgi:uncharacterized protein (TIGR00369 family)